MTTTLVMGIDLRVLRLHLNLDVGMQKEAIAGMREGGGGKLPAASR